MTAHQQLDLFLDGAPMIARNRLMDALLADDAAAARAAYDHLRGIDPELPVLGEACSLIEARECGTPLGVDAGLDRLARIEGVWSAAALAVLGSRSREFLAPLWRDVGQALEPVVFDAKNPSRHASYAYTQGRAWAKVRNAVLAVTDFEHQPDLLDRLAQAQWRLGDRPAALLCWFKLCWLEPMVFVQEVDNRIPDISLKMAWQEFLEQDVEVWTPWFPAWMLCHEPGLVRVLPASGGNSQAELGFNVLRTLLCGHQGEIELRSELQRLNPVLLARFLETL